MCYFDWDAVMSFLRLSRKVPRECSFSVAQQSSSSLCACTLRFLDYAQLDTHTTHTPHTTHHTHTHNTHTTHTHHTHTTHTPQTHTPHTPYTHHTHSTHTTHTHHTRPEYFIYLPFISWHSYILTHSLTPHSTVLLEKLTGSQPVKKFPTFYGTRRKFITTFTSARHLSIS